LVSHPEITALRRPGLAIDGDDDNFDADSNVLAALTAGPRMDHARMAAMAAAGDADVFARESIPVPKGPVDTW
jgi:hypothetical protein